MLGICVQDQLLACLFGIVGGKEGHNAIVLLIKQYIVTTKLSNQITTHQVKTPTYEGALASIVNHIVKEKKIATRNIQTAQFVEKWGDILNRLHL